MLLQQNFDAVTAPNLPTGWTRDGTTNWTTVSTDSDTPPQAAFVGGIASITDNWLSSPSVNIPASGTVQLTFRHRYDLESIFDGAVLEFSVNGGAFADLVTGGGTVLSGGYNSLISTNWGSPIGGRQAWSGASGAFITTTVNLPSSTAGKAVVLRWRMATDNAIASAGWWVDTVLLKVL